MDQRTYPPAGAAGRGEVRARPRVVIVGAGCQLSGRLGSSGRSSM